jgi:hypothetical protein
MATQQWMVAQSGTPTWSLLSKDAVKSLMMTPKSLSTLLSALVITKNLGANKVTPWKTSLDSEISNNTTMPLMMSTKSRGHSLMSPGDTM